MTFGEVLVYRFYFSVSIFLLRCIILDLIWLYADRSLTGLI